jgi:hypothetical protein
VEVARVLFPHRNKQYQITQLISDWNILFRVTSVNGLWRQKKLDCRNEVTNLRQDRELRFSVSNGIRTKFDIFPQKIPIYKTHYRSIILNSRRRILTRTTHSAFFSRPTQNLPRKFVIYGHSRCNQSVELEQLMLNRSRSSD